MSFIRWLGVAGAAIAVTSPGYPIYLLLVFRAWRNGIIARNERIAPVPILVRAILFWFGHTLLYFWVMIGIFTYLFWGV